LDKSVGRVGWVFGPARIETNELSKVFLYKELLTSLVVSLRLRIALGYSTTDLDELWTTFIVK
jgi:hypothetical protein